MRLASDVLFAVGAFFLTGTMLAVSRWAMTFGVEARSSVEALVRMKHLPDALSYLVFAVFFAFVGLIVRVW